MIFRLLAIIVIILFTSPLALTHEPQINTNKSKIKIKKPVITKAAKKRPRSQLTNQAQSFRGKGAATTKMEPAIKPQELKSSLKPQVKALNNLNAQPAKYISNMEDETNLLQIINFSTNQQWDQAAEIAERCIDTKYAQTIIKSLKIYYNPQALTVKEMSDFFNENRWISLEPFNNKIEKSMTYDNPPGSILEWFYYREPQTNSGKFTLLNAQIVANLANLENNDTKHKLRELWRTTEFDLSTEEYYLKKYKDHLTIEDLLKKIEFLTWNKSYTYANQLLSILPPQYKKLPKLRLEIAQSKFNLGRTLANTGTDLLNDDFIMHVNISNLLDNDKENEATNKLLSVKPKSGFENWWKLKNIAIRNCLRDKKYKQAYALTENHHLEYGSDMAEAEWLGGWIALRFLEDPEAALKRFANLFEKTKLSNSKSKGAYWIGRSYEKLGDTENALKWYDVASQYKGTFYGHLALAANNRTDKANYFEHVAHTTDKKGNYSDKENAKKLTYFSYLLHKSDVKLLANNLIATLADLDIDRNDLEVAALYFTNRKYYPFAVEISKSTSNKGAPLIQVGYPKHIEINNNELPKGLYLGIMRQESMFDPNALSPAGARGLMQLMPATASRMAQILGLPKNAFAVDPSSNVRKGVSYFDQLYKQFENVPMSIAAYNAGPGNVKKWIDRYGDPRESKDPYFMIDWIESIPFNETRNYVKKVLENYVVYDSILDNNHASNAILGFLEK